MNHISSIVKRNKKQNHMRYLKYTIEREKQCFYPTSALIFYFSCFSILSRVHSGGKLLFLFVSLSSCLWNSVSSGPNLCLLNLVRCKERWIEPPVNVNGRHRRMVWNHPDIIARRPRNASEIHKAPLTEVIAYHQSCFADTSFTQASETTQDESTAPVNSTCWGCLIRWKWAFKDE